MSSTLATGDPSDERTVVGPLIDQGAARRIEGWIGEAVAQGAGLLSGGARAGSVASKTVELLTQEWSAGSTTEAMELRRKAEIHAADNGGPKIMQVSLALDRLLETVAEVSKDMRDEGTRTIQSTTYWIVPGSFFIALLNLFLSRTSRARDTSSRREEPSLPGSPVGVSADGPNPALRID